MDQTGGNNAQERKGLRRGGRPFAWATLLIGTVGVLAAASLGTLAQAQEQDFASDEPALFEDLTADPLLAAADGDNSYGANDLGASDFGGTDATPAGDAESTFGGGGPETWPLTQTEDVSDLEVLDEVLADTQTDGEALDLGDSGNDRPLTTDEVRRSLLPSTSFTTSSAFNPLAERTSIIGNERTIIRFGMSYLYDSNAFDLSDTRRVERQVIVTPGRAATPAVPASPGVAAQPAQPAVEPVTKTVVSYEDQEVIAGTTASADLTLGYQGGSLRGPGLSYSLVYGADFFANETDQTSDTGINHALSGDVGLRGGFTEIRFSAGFTQDSGQGFQQSQLRREAPRAQSKNYTVNFGVTRKLATGSLEFGAAAQKEEFDQADSPGVAVSGQNRWSVDGAWFYDPPFLAYTTLGLGLNYGKEDVQSGLTQNFLTPSLRGRWAISPFTSVAAFGGLETRWLDGESLGDGYSTPVFGIDGRWQAQFGTSLSAGINRSVQQSISQIGQNAVTTTFSLGLGQQITDGLSAGLTYRYELADYESAANGQATYGGKNDNYHQFGASLNQRLRLGGFVTGQVSLFYNFNMNAGETPDLEYKQHITGVRVGVDF